MIPRLHKRGASFKGACQYILHDPKTTSRERVLWTDISNLVNKADDAWFEMFATARDQAELKRQSGQDARGRKNQKPVMHLSLSWAIGENPTQQHMLETARSALNAIGLGEHQALIAAHNDKQHLHVHMVVNTIHPVTGMTAALKYTKERLSRWAEAYEKEHGLHCEQRVANNRQRDESTKARQASALLMVGDISGLRDPNAEAKKPPYVPVKHKGPSRREWFAIKDLKDRMSRLRAAMDLPLKVERNALREHHDLAYKALRKETANALDHARSGIREQFKPQWRDLYRIQKRELRHVAGASVFERAVFVFGQRDRLRHSKPLSLRSAMQLIRNPAKLAGRLETVHARERRSLAQMEKTQAHVYADRIWSQHAVRLEKLKSDQSAERRQQREAHHAATRSVTLQMAKASLAQDCATPDQIPANTNGFKRVDEIKQKMAEWRRKNTGRDFGREL